MIAFGAGEYGWKLTQLWFVKRTSEMMLNIIKWAFQRPTAHHRERKLII